MSVNDQVRLIGTPKEKEFKSLIKSKADINKKNLMYLFAMNLKKEIKYKPSDVISITPDMIDLPISAGETTVGIYITNKFIFEDLKIFGYVNKPLTGEDFGAMDVMLADALMENDITIEQYSTMIDSLQWLFGGSLSAIINPSLSINILSLPKATAVLKDKLLKENADAIRAGDIIVAAKIEKALVASAEEEIRKTGDPAMDLFDSKCGVSFSNNYKTMFIMKGPVNDNNDPTQSKFNVVTSDYDNGLNKEDFAAMADSIVLGAYMRGIATAISGYYAKKYNAMFQNVRLLPQGSDCGTKKTMDILLDKNALQYWKYSYFVVNGKLTQLNNKSYEQYKGKIVKMRVPQHCIAKRPYFCNKCYGDKMYMMGLSNVGLSFNRIPNSEMNQSLKKFHDISIKLYEIDVERDFLAGYRH